MSYLPTAVLSIIDIKAVVERALEDEVKGRKWRCSRNGRSKR